ncbi:MAG: hypothetical protein GX369_02355 [Euryarchaeota archaeon]|nr:hypothetical protein [Euryarchaeota archaeon]
MKLKLKFIDDEGEESGICNIYKLMDDDLKKIGEIKYSDQSDKRWIIDVVKFQTNVSIID